MCLRQKDQLLRHAEETEGEFLSTIKVKVTLMKKVLKSDSLHTGVLTELLTLGSNGRFVWNICSCVLSALLSDKGSLLSCRISGWQNRSWDSSWRREKMKPRCNLDMIFCFERGNTLWIPLLCPCCVCSGFQCCPDWSDWRWWSTQCPSELCRGNEASDLLRQNGNKRVWFILSQTCMSFLPYICLSGKHNINAFRKKMLSWEVGTTELRWSSLFVSRKTVIPRSSWVPRIKLQMFRLKGKNIKHCLNVDVCVPIFFHPVSSSIHTHPVVSVISKVCRCVADSSPESGIICAPHLRCHHSGIYGFRKLCRTLWLPCIPDVAALLLCALWLLTSHLTWTP